MDKDKFCAKVLMYRYEENQLQVFVEETAHGLTFPDLAEGDKHQVVDRLNAEAGQDEHIPLDPVTCEMRKRDVLAYAFEIDWRKLPVSSKRRQFVETNKGVFIAAKEVMKKNMPAEYKMMKELVEVLSMRNIIKNL